MSNQHYSPGMLTPSAAESLGELGRQNEVMKRQVDDLSMRSATDIFPASITSGAAGYHAWTEQWFNENGLRYTRPGGRTGTAAYEPAVLPDRTTFIEFPQAVWLKRTIWNTTYSVIYEVVSEVNRAIVPPVTLVTNGGGVGTVALSFSTFGTRNNTGVTFTLTEKGMWLITGTIVTTMTKSVALAASPYLQLDWNKTGAGSSVIYHQADVVQEVSYLASNDVYTETNDFSMCINVTQENVTYELVLVGFNTSPGSASYNAGFTNIKGIKLTSTSTVIATGLTVGSTVISGASSNGDVLTNNGGALGSSSTIDGGTF